jgi:AcrR family transcriptional regulator
VVRRVLDAALVELARSGYAGFRMDEVASKAAVNKTTIYRRWPSRAALVTALVDRMRRPLRESPLPDTGRLERDLVEAFTRRFTVGRKVEGRAWARLLEERYNREVEAIIGAAVDERSGEWRSMVTRAVDRGELPPGTDAPLLLTLVRAIVDARGSSRRLDTAWLTLAVRTVIAGARAGTLVRGRRTEPRRQRGRRRGSAAGARFRSA